MTTHEVERWSPFKAWIYTLLQRSPKSNAAIVRYASLTEADRFLDIGCGPGAALEEAVTTGASVAGIDPSASMVERASKRVPQADVRLGSAEEIPFDDEVFNVVVNVASFHHWADRDAGLKEALRVLEPGGRLHIVEGKLNDGKDGHGLSPSDTRLLVERLGELGYTDPDADTIRTSRHRDYVVVSAVKPG